MFSIAVQPPAQARANAKLYPPVIAKGRPAGTTEIDAPYLFATAVLRDADGNLSLDRLRGTLSATGLCLEETRSSSGTGQPVAFMFPDLSVAYEGSYSIRVDVYYVDYQDGQGAVLVDQVETRMFDISDLDVPSQRPSSEERSIIRKLRDQGHPVPSSPV
ncbi:hypothetical protein jhhlp_002132 [Lomentospora prolificans]|uniref:Velvet domain-containing protein n=1 Tax=Lomentospora prolificans TaxID=41688 RepID=A0A2N3ND71_9PEZI|nr:hypothetical protein jhhlp_002132 [Lomentospora prolificans]